MRALGALKSVFFDILIFLEEQWAHADQELDSYLQKQSAWQEVFLKVDLRLQCEGYKS